MKIVDNYYIALDCDQPVALAKFYAALTGLSVEDLGDQREEEVSWIELKDDQDKTRLAFQKIDNYLAPTWPTGPLPQQAHLDLAVKDLLKAEQEILKLGAIKAQFQPGSPKVDPYSTEFIVYLDPAGHPFCLIHRP